MSHLRKLVKEKDAFSLGFSNGLHDPDVLILEVLIFFELIHKDHVLGGEDVGLGIEVVALGFVLLAFPFQCFPVFLKIPDQQVLSAKFEVIAEMVDLLVGLKSFLVQFVDVVLFTPDYIPIIGLSFLVALFLEGFMDAIGEVGFVLDDGTRVRESGTRRKGIPF